MQKLLNLEEPLGNLFEGSGKETTYVGTLPRPSVLNKIMYLDQLRFMREANNCPLSLHDHAADEQSLAYSRALSKGASPEEQVGLREIYDFWKAWIEEEMDLPEPSTPEQLLTKYLERTGLHACSEGKTQSQCG